jgi:hypothetical protein
VTEAFEAHHLTSKASNVLEKFYVREASQPRNYKFTFNEDGFFKTLKRRVVKKLETVDAKKHLWKSKLILDVNLIALFAFGVIAVSTKSVAASIFWTLLAAQSMAWSANFAHNFIHQKDNWRMYTSNFSFFAWRDFRVFHAMSHHMFPNTYSDMEVLSYESHLNWIPYSNKTLIRALYSYIASPFIWTLMFPFTMVTRYKSHLKFM